MSCKYGCNSCSSCRQGRRHEYEEVFTSPIVKRSRFDVYSPMMRKDTFLHRMAYSPNAYNNKIREKNALLYALLRRLRIMSPQDNRYPTFQQQLQELQKELAELKQKHAVEEQGRASLISYATQNAGDLIPADIVGPILSGDWSNWKRTFYKPVIPSSENTSTPPYSLAPSEDDGLSESGGNPVNPMAGLDNATAAAVPQEAEAQEQADNTNEAVQNPLFDKNAEQPEKPRAPSKSDSDYETYKALYGTPGNSPYVSSESEYDEEGNRLPRPHYDFIPSDSEIESNASSYHTHGSDDEEEEPLLNHESESDTETTATDDLMNEQRILPEEEPIPLREQYKPKEEQSGIRPYVEQRPAQQPIPIPKPQPRQIESIDDFTLNELKHAFQIRNIEFDKNISLKDARNLAIDSNMSVNNIKNAIKEKLPGLSEKIIEHAPAVASAAGSALLSGVKTGAGVGASLLSGVGSIAKKLLTTPQTTQKQITAPVPASTPEPEEEAGPSQPAPRVNEPPQLSRARAYASQIHEQALESERQAEKGKGPKYPSPSEAGPSQPPVPSQESESEEEEQAPYNIHVLPEEYNQNYMINISDYERAIPYLRAIGELPSGGRVRTAAEVNAYKQELRQKRPDIDLDVLIKRWAGHRHPETGLSPMKKHLPK